jgi:tetratricopeptide (TPR) repeat protein
MPKTPSLKLYNLIKSLSGSEKRYFKLFATGNRTDKSSKYLVLFDAIDGQEVFDDEALKKIVYQGEQILSRKYSELKAYLYDLILAGLQGYDEKSSIDFKIKGMLQSLRVLFKRSHYEDCRDLLPKIKKLAYKYESFPNILEVLTWERKVAYAQMDIAFLNSHLARIDQEEKVCLENLRNLSFYQNIFFRILIHIRKNAVLRTNEQKEILDEIINSDILTDISKTKSHHAKITFHRIYGLYYYAIHDYQNFYASSKAAIELMESVPHFLKEDTSEYISALSNYVLSCGLLDKYAELEQNMHKFSEIQPVVQSDKLTIYRQLLAANLRIFINKGDFKSGLALLNKHLREKDDFKRNAFEKGTFYFQYFYIYFGIGDYDKALEYLNEWLNIPRSIERQDLQSLARVLNLIIHFEMNNTILLDNLLRSTYRFLKKRNRMYKLERSVLSFIKDANKTASSRALKEAFVKLKEAFEAFAKDPSENVMFQYFDFISWVDSKINNETFAKAVKRRYEIKD